MTERREKISFRLSLAAIGLTSVALDSPALAQGNLYGPHDRPFRFEEKRRMGAFQKLPAAPGYRQRLQALEERRKMFPPEYPPVPTYDPRTHELRDGKLFRK